MKVLGNGDNLIKSWTEGLPEDEGAIRQLENIASMPFVYKHIAVMPDYHLGMGSTIGSVIPTIGAVIPAAVGVDINCGMMAIKTTMGADDIPCEVRPKVRALIEKYVPTGRTNDGGEGDRGAWNSVPSHIKGLWDASLAKGFGDLIEKYPKLKPYNSVNHLGSLGTGNHFIEVCLDGEGCVWIMLHSGSRGPGNKIGMFFTKLAQEKCKQWFIDLPDPDLAYFPQGTDEYNDYMKAVSWATNFATMNRQIMLDIILDTIRSCKELPDFKTEDPINCNHNYLAVERHFGKDIIVTRKGAIRAKQGDLGIIPGSMGNKSYIVEGLGNRDSFCSASHGAGRKMSRTQACKEFTIEDHILATKGVECLKDESVLDETPAAYKDIDMVMEAQKELVKPIVTLKQIICVKGKSEKRKKKEKKATIEKKGCC